MLNLSQRMALQQKLTPQQVQYLQLLQLPVLALEQRIKAELEMNPLLEEGDELELTQEEEIKTEENIEDNIEEIEQGNKDNGEPNNEDGYSFEDFMNDDLAGYKTERSIWSDEDREEFPQRAELTLTQKLIEQVRLLDLSDEEIMLGEEIIGNIDEDGYLRRELKLIIEDLNLSHNLNLSEDTAEKVLQKIQRLDPPGIGARNLRECLLVQLEVGEYDPNLKEKAETILRNYFESFTLKHYEELAKYLNITIEQLKPVIELIQRLNPKPGEGQIVVEQNYITPDFFIERDNGDFIVTLNERNVPPIRINKNYKELMAKHSSRKTKSEVKEFLRKKFEAAKWLIVAINQRRETMLKVMRAIIEKQREFFETGENLKPMIYKDIAELIGMDISTISRVVNGKYAQTEFGVYELRYFFSDKLTMSNGQEISNKEVKNKIKKIIESEDSNNPLSDDRIAEILNKEGLNIARRTVAKYREAMKIPIARLRRKI